MFQEQILEQLFNINLKVYDQSNSIIWIFYKYIIMFRLGLDLPSPHLSQTFIDSYFLE